LAKFASKIRVSTHWLEATEAARRLSAILPGVDRDLYRRRQRRRAIIAWSVLGLVVVAVGLGIAFGDEGSQQDSTEASLVKLFSWEMSSDQYQQIHKGQSESRILDQLHTVGLQEDEIEESDLLSLFPPAPSSSTCSYWKLSDAPDHLVRLCFSDPQGVLLQKSVRAPGESGGAETTLA
jgi:hypothetical protein